MRTTRYALITNDIITHIIEIPDKDVGRMGSVWERLARRYEGTLVMLPFGGQIGDAVRVNHEGGATVTVANAWHPQAASRLDGSAIPERAADGMVVEMDGAAPAVTGGVWQYVEPSLVEHYRSDLGREVIAVEADRSPSSSL